MAPLRTYDLFITHGWRYHDDWKRLHEMMDHRDPHGWRNFSLPWYDPALRPASDEGRKILEACLETQILPAHAVILLASVWALGSARSWVEFELDVARRHRKRVIALPAFGGFEPPEEVRALADEVVPWDLDLLLAAVERGRLPDGGSPL